MNPGSKSSLGLVHHDIPQNRKDKGLNKEHHQKYNSADNVQFPALTAGKFSEEWKLIHRSVRDKPAEKSTQCIGHQIIHIRCPVGKHLQQFYCQRKAKAKGNRIPQRLVFLPQNRKADATRHK